MKRNRMTQRDTKQLQTTHSSAIVAATTKRSETMTKDII